MTGLRYFAIHLRNTASAAEEGKADDKRGNAMTSAGGYAYLPLERVVFGQPAADAALEEMARVGATRAFIVAAKSLVRNTPVVSGIADRLGLIMSACSTAASSTARVQASLKRRVPCAQPHPI